MLAEWANRGLNQWTIEQRTQTVTANDVDYSLGTDVIDILSAVVRRSSTGRCKKSPTIFSPQQWGHSSFP